MPRTTYEEIVSVAGADSDYRISGDSVALILALLSPFYLSSLPENEDAAMALVDKAIRELMTPSPRLRQVGEIYATISVFAEPGHLPLDGQVLLREEYEQLWQVVPAHWRITLTSPEGESVQTIWLPDQTNNMYLAGGSVLATGVQFGQNTYTLSLAQMPAHSHSHTIRANAGGFGTSAPAQANISGSISSQVGSVAGNGAPIDNRPASLGVRWMIVATVAE